MKIKNLLIIILSFGILFCLDYSLEDVNPDSETYGIDVGPSYFQSQGQPISMSAFNHEN